MTLGISGMLYQSTVLFYDHQTKSLWSQVDGKAVTGKMLGSKLKQIPLVRTTWGAWKKKYPHTLVLSTDTGFRRNYSGSPYESYYQTQRLMFPVNRRSSKLKNKDLVLGITVNGRAKAYPFDVLSKVKMPFKDKIGNKQFVISFDKKTNSATVTYNETPYPSFSGFWFAWYAFHPKTEVFKKK